MAHILPFTPMGIDNEMEDIRIRLEEVDAELNHMLTQDTADIDWDARARLLAEARVLKRRAQQLTVGVK